MSYFPGDNQSVTPTVLHVEERSRTEYRGRGRAGGWLALHGLAPKQLVACRALPRQAEAPRLQ